MSVPKDVNLPNCLTVGRMCLTPALVILLSGDAWGAALGVFVAAMATDALDGYLARSRGLVTDFGRLMDPIADKLLIGAAFVCLAAIERIDPWAVAVILTREAAVSGIRLAARRHGLVISANRLGKAKTAVQTVTIVVLIVVGDPGAAWIQALVGATVAITVISGLAYAVNYYGGRRAPVAPATTPG
ncbi:MAG: CDP-diacylglycerol--glycerol-3-phosphate 3-phosphatidyltransferase [Solirubrobacterales bacterium]